jgi:hypothetical protein
MYIPNVDQFIRTYGFMFSTLRYLCCTFTFGLIVYMVLWFQLYLYAV